MAKEITATGKRAAMLNSMRPRKEQLGSLDFKKHRATVAFELEVVSNKINRFGWGSMSNAMKDRLTLDWMDVLDSHGVDEIKEACSALMGRKPRDATNEHMVKAVILAGRAKALSAIPKPLPLPEPERSEPSAESKERVNEMVKGFSASLKMRIPSRKGATE